LLQVSPSASSFRSPVVVGRVVVVEPDLSLPSNAPENPDVRVGHDDPAPSRTTRAACAAGRAAALRERDFFAAAVMTDAFLLFWLERRPGSEKSWAL
jgi:hypothetical protein